MNRLVKLLISLVLPLLVGYIGSLFTSISLSSWYINLNKPSFTPPSWLFGPVWTALFILMGLAFYFLWEKGYTGKLFAPFMVYFGQLFFNLLWSAFFFGLRNPVLAFVDIVLLWILILINIVLFFRQRKLSGILLLPYILWVSFASVLTLAIVILN